MHHILSSARSTVNQRPQVPKVHLNLSFRAADHLLRFCDQKLNSRRSLNVVAPAANRQMPSHHPSLPHIGLHDLLVALLFIHLPRDILKCYAS